MALGLRDLHGNAAAEAGRKLATVADLERELEQRRAEAEQAARDAAEAARLAEVERRQAEQTGRTRLAELERELTAALAEGDDERAPLLLRGRARQWLHGGDPEMASHSLELTDLCGRDPVAARLQRLHQQLGAVTVYLTGEAGLDQEHEQVTRADHLECKAWQTLMGRVRWLAGRSDGPRRGPGSGRGPERGGRRPGQSLDS